jgi:hypothetical protein
MIVWVGIIREIEHLERRKIMHVISTSPTETDTNFVEDFRRRLIDRDLAPATIPIFAAIFTMMTNQHGSNGTGM